MVYYTIATHVLHLFETSQGQSSCHKCSWYRESISSQLGPEWYILYVVIETGV